VNPVNLNGLVLIGSGSEWFWSMLQFVIVTVTLYAIYRQVRLQASTAAIEQIDRIVKDWTSETALRHTLDLRLAIRSEAAPEALPYGAASFVGDFWEGIGYLVRQGHIPRRLLHENLGDAPQWWWAVLESWAKQVRVETNQPGALEHFEWLAGQMADLDRKRGAGTDYTPSFIASTLENRIANDRERLVVAEKVRSVMTRSRDTGDDSIRRRRHSGRR
jgi:hypothetical protein